MLIHNAAHLYVGVTEAFSPKQLLTSFDTNAVGAMRVNRAVLPHMRKANAGLLIDGAEMRPVFGGNVIERQKMSRSFA